MATATTHRDSQDVCTSTATSFDHWRHLVAESFVPLVAQTEDPETSGQQPEQPWPPRLSCEVTFEPSGATVQLPPPRHETGKDPAASPALTLQAPAMPAACLSR